MKMRKIAAIAAALVMTVSLAACGGSSSSSAESKSSSAPAAAAQSTSEAAAASSAASAESSAPAAEIKADALVLRIGTGTGGKERQAVWMEEFEKQLEAATDGAIDVQCYPAGQLGTMAELVQGTVDGTVDAACFPTSYFSTIFSGASVIDLHNMFPHGGAQLHNILMTQDTAYEQEFINHGVIPVTWLLAPDDYKIISNTKIESLSELKGKVIWCMPSSVLIKELEMLEIVSSTINVGELAPSLQNGTVDGAISSLSLFFSQSLQSSGGKYLLEAPRDSYISIFGISQHWWDRCPDDLKEIVQKVANDSIDNFEIGYATEQIDAAYQVMQGDGMEVVVPSDEFTKEIDDALAGLDDWFLSTYPEAKDVYDDMVARVEADTTVYE